MLSSRRSLPVECSRPTKLPQQAHMNLKAAVSSAARPGVTPVHRGSDATSEGVYLGLEATTKYGGIQRVGVAIIFFL